MLEVLGRRRGRCGMIPCVDCKTPTEAGRPCPNRDCEPPTCPDCGYRPWHDRAVCPECQPGPDALTVEEIEEIDAQAEASTQRRFGHELGGAP